MKILSYKRVLLNICCTSTLVFSSVLSSADIVSDKNAAPQHQAEVTTTSSNVPMVNIVAPNSSGLSHNKFDRYSVTPKHLIINKGNSISTINATNVNNTGVIASASDLTIKATSTLTNGSAQSDSSVNALIFSVGKMSLFSNILNNKYSDIYSIGDLIIAKNIQNEMNAQVNNLSSGMESNGNLSIFTQSLQNKREAIQISDGSLLCQNVSDVLTSLCQSTIRGGQSSGIANNTSIQTAWLFNETFQFWNQNLSQVDQQTDIYNIINQVLKASLRTPNITAGKNLTITADDVLNQASLLSAVNNIQIDATNFENSTVAAVLPYPIQLSYLTNTETTSPNDYIFTTHGAYQIFDNSVTPYSDLNHYEMFERDLILDDHYDNHISHINNHLPTNTGTFKFLSEAEFDALPTPGEANAYLDQLNQIDSSSMKELKRNRWDNTLNLSQSVLDQYITDLLNFKNNHSIVENSHYLSYAPDFTTIEGGYNPDYDIYFAYNRKIADYALFPATLIAGNNITINASNNINLGVSQINPVQSSTAPSVNLSAAQVSSNSSANTSLHESRGQPT